MTLLISLFFIMIAFFSLPLKMAIAVDDQINYRGPLDYVLIVILL